MKRIIFLAMAAFTAGIGAYTAFKDLAEAMENWDDTWDDEEDLSDL